MHTGNVWRRGRSPWKQAFEGQKHETVMCVTFGDRVGSAGHAGTGQRGDQATVRSHQNSAYVTFGSPGRPGATARRKDKVQKPLRVRIDWIAGFERP